MTEHTANAALADAAAQRIEWEGAHMDAWMQPAPKRAPRRADRRAEDYALLGMLACTLIAIVAGVL